MEPILSLKNIIKDFPGVRALDNASLNVYKGKVMGLVGENDAGKSTILKILTGIHQPTSGEYYIHNKKITLNGVLDAKTNGLCIVHQELEIMQHLTILENMFVGSEIKTKFGTYDWSTMRKIANKVLIDLKVSLHADQKMHDLSIGQQQMVEIAKAALSNAKVICLDEPTSSLTNKEINSLFELIKRLKTQGVSFIYVSHRMDEIPAICDDITVFRDGKFIIEKSVKTFSANEIVKHIVGRELTEQYPRIKIKKGNEALSIKNWFAPKVKGVSFEAFEGEILGFFGLMGAGRTELFKSIIGYTKSTSGKMYVYSKEKEYFSPRNAIKDKLFYLSEDRKGEGLILSFPHYKNISLASLGDFLSSKILQTISRSKETKEAKRQINSISVKCSHPGQKTGNLSGGNQQKIAIGKALSANPDIIIFDEPTRGIDVGAKKEIYSIINDLKKEGKCIIIISSEIQEIIGISDRVNVMAEGKIIAKYVWPNYDQEEIIKKIVNTSVN